MFNIVGFIVLGIFAVWLIGVLGCIAIVGYGEYLTRKDEKETENTTEIVVISRTEG